MNVIFARQKMEFTAFIGSIAREGSNHLAVTSNIR
jgi:hypothetical protein